MADLTSSNVTITRSFDMGSRTSKSIAKRLYGSMVLSSHGTLTAGSRIPASAFGLTNFHWAADITKSDNSAVIDAAADSTNTYLLLASAGTPATQTGTFNFVLEGY